MTTRRHHLIASLVAVVLALAAAPIAHGASGGAAVIADCNQHLKLTTHYSVSELQNALATLPADIASYSNCKDVINRALLVAEGKVSGGSGGGSGGGSALPTPVIVVLVILALGAVTFGAIAIRRRRK